MVGRGGGGPKEKKRENGRMYAIQSNKTYLPMVQLKCTDATHFRKPKRTKRKKKDAMTIPNHEEQPKHASNHISLDIVALLPLEVIVHIVHLGKWDVALVLARVCTKVRSAVREWQRTIDEVYLKSYDRTANLLEAVVFAAPYMSSLTKLVMTHFVWNDKIDQLILQIVRHTPRLKYIDLSYNDIDDDTVMSITTLCLEMEHIDVSWCYSVTDNSLVAISLQCPNLRYIDVSRCSVSDAGVASIARACVELRFVGIGFTETLTTLEPLRSCVRLEQLDVRECERIERVPADAWPYLKNVNLTGCAVNDAAIVDIARHCSDLEHLNLTQCTSISDHSIVEIASSCPKLQTLHIHECQHLTGAAIDAIAKNCVHLCRLEALKCYSISYAAFERLKAQRPHTKIRCSMC